MTARRLPPRSPAAGSWPTPHGTPQSPPDSDETGPAEQARPDATGASGWAVNISPERLDTLHPALLLVAFHHPGPVYADDGGLVVFRDEPAPPRTQHRLAWAANHPRNDGPEQKGST